MSSAARSPSPRRRTRPLLLLPCLLLGLALPVAHAQETPPLGHLFERERQRLDGAWNHIVEPLGQALRIRNVRRDFPHDGPPPEGLLVEYDWDASPTLAVPGDWNHQASELMLYEGVVWYRRRFTPAVRGARQFLYFEAANYATHVFLNGEKLGVHEGGFTPFAFEVTDRLRAGENSLVVAVDNRRRADAVPALRTDWWNYGGITRSVWLVGVPQTFVRDVVVRFHDAGGPTVMVEAVLDGPDAAGAEVTLALPELGLLERVRATPGGRAGATFRPAAVERWRPERPRRYEVVVEAVGDRVTDQVGLRTVGVRGTEILLNGEPVFWRGVSIHEEAFGPVGRRAHAEADYRELLEAARSLGANFVRLAHYPHGERMVRLADSLGLMVWAEIPVYWEDIAYENDGTYAAAERMLRAMIARDANRAAVVVWSVANETPVTEHRLVFLRRLVEVARRHDPTRLVSAALKSTSLEAAAADGAGAERATAALPRHVQLVDDPLGAYLDVLAVNTYVGWYGAATPYEIAEVEWRTPFDKPVVLSEYGADAVAGLRGDPLERWTEDYQALLLDQTTAVAARTPFIQGTMPWVLKDFRSPRRWHAVHQRFWNRKGLFSETGEEKPGAEVIRRWYARFAAGERPTAPLGVPTLVP